MKIQYLLVLCLMPWLAFGGATEKLNSFFEATERNRHAQGKFDLTQQALVWHKGQEIYSFRSSAKNAEGRQLTWSISKSILHALVGIAVKEERLKLNESICTYLPQFTQLCAIRVQHLLEWSSGLDWEEAYEGGDLSKSAVVQMLYGDGHRAGVAFVGNHRLLYAPPGSRHSYSSGDSHLLMGVLRSAYRSEDWGRLPWTKLFFPLGMTTATWERDGQGDFYGSSYLYLSARDLATFGQLYLQNGKWKGKQILPSNWVSHATEIPQGFLNLERIVKKHNIPGRHWWLNKSISKKGIPIPWSNAPEDTFSARGHWGQRLIVIPSLQIVAVRLGLTRGHRKGFRDNDLVGLINDLLKEKGLTP